MPIGIAAIEYELPDHSVGLEELERGGRLESSAATLAGFGFGSVRISDRPAVELASTALGRLLDRAAVAAESIDALFFAGAIPRSHTVRDAGGLLDDFSYPVARLAYEHGLINAMAIGISQVGCMGLMTAVKLAAEFLRAHPASGRAVCVSADVLPPDAGREIIYNVISDGACAVLVERDSPCNHILVHRQVTKGYYWDAAVKRNEIVAAYFPTGRNLIRDTLDGLGLIPADVSLVLPHNVSRRSWEILLPLVGIAPDRLFADNIASKGHVIAADNFINLKDADETGLLKAGDRLLLFNFGFGANWGCLVLEH